MLWVLLGLLLAAPAAGQQRGADTRTWYQAYQDGRQQVQRGDWQAAIASLEAAKRNGPKPGRRIPFYGDVYDDFLPDYFLGIAYLNAGRAQDAVKAFTAVNDAKLIAQRDREYAEFTRQLTAANDRVRAESQVAQVAQQSPPPQQQQQPQQTSQQQAPTPVPTAPVTQSAANNPPDVPVRAPDAGATKDPAPPAQSPVQTAPLRSAAAPTSRPAAAATPTPAAADKQPTPRPNPPAVANAATGGTRAEVEGLRAFFSGDYRRAANTLAALAASGASPRVEFYLACSLAALALTESAAPATLDEARARFRAVNGAQLANDQRYVSPRIIAVLRDTPRQ